MSIEMYAKAGRVTPEGLAKVEAAVRVSMQRQYVKQVREQLAKVRREVDAAERMLVALLGEPE